MGKFIRRLFTLSLLGLLVYGGYRYAWVGQQLLENQKLPAEEKVYVSLLEEREHIILAGYGLDGQSFPELWKNIMYTHGDLFFVNTQYEYLMLGDHILAVTPTYDLQGEPLLQARVDYEADLQEILAGISPQWTDLEKALYLHDYLCMHYAYDTSLTRYTAAEMLRQHLGVCQSYTLLYHDLLSACGIEADYRVSHEMNHTWNTVRLDGQLYHVDVTYDDPTADRPGRALHRYFLVSDQSIAEDHKLSPQDEACADTRYDDALWQSVSSGFVPVGDTFYFLKGANIYAWRDGQAPKPIHTILSTWFTSRGDQSYWEGNFSVLWATETELLYNTSDAVLALNPVSGAVRTLYTHSGPDSIYGFTYSPGTLTLRLGTSPNEDGRSLTVNNIRA